MTTTLRDSLLKGVANQFGRPHGLLGRLVVARLLDRGNRGTVTAAAAALAPAADETVADIGFGGGLGLELLLARAARVHGVDIATAMIDRAATRFRGNDRLRLHPGSITALPLDTASLDGAICVNTVYFVEDLAKAFGELARVLVPGGRLVLGVADPAAMAEMPHIGYGFRLRPVADLVAALAEAGLPMREHRRVGTGERAFHLLITQRVT